jgi:hypothetical protein
MTLKHRSIMWMLVDDFRHFVQEVEVSLLEVLVLSLVIGYACTCAFASLFI